MSTKPRLIKMYGVFSKLFLEGQSGNVVSAVKAERLEKIMVRVHLKK